MEWLKYWWTMRRLQRQRVDLRRRNRAEIAKIRAAHGNLSQEYSDFSAEAIHDERLADEAVQNHRSKWLLEEAERKLIQTPDYDDAEAWDGDDGRWDSRLTRDAIAALQAKIHKHDDETSKIAFAWISALTGLGGVIVAILALVGSGS
jgi:DNA transposition AAA+ family ATPase